MKIRPLKFVETMSHEQFDRFADITFSIIYVLTMVALIVASWTLEYAVELVN